MPNRPGTRLRRKSLCVLVERVLFSSAAAVALAGAPASPVQAATIVVSAAGDTAVTNPATCTLRQAVVSMNTGAVAGTGCTASGSFGSNDRVEFAAGLFSANLATITLQDTLNIGHQLPIDRRDPPRPVKHLAIDAGAGRQVIVQRNPAAPPFAVIATRPAGKVGGTITRGSLRLTGLIVQNGYANGQTWTAGKYMTYTGGGGVFARQADVVIERSTIRNNQAHAGGGMYITGSLTMDSSTVSGNVTPLVFSTDSVKGGMGGGLFVAGPAVIRNSTISGNVTNGEFGGGGMVSKYNRGDTPGAGVLISNSTISGNAVNANGDYAGSALVFAGDDLALTLLNSTIACNRGAPAAIRFIPSAGAGPTPRITASSTVFANTANAACPGLSGPVVEFGHFAGPIRIEGNRNLVASGSAMNPQATFATAPTFGDPLLGALQNNGGPTFTHALGASSPARNAGANPAGLGDDQRGPGFTRTVAATDIGAFEDQFIGLCGTAHGSAFTAAPATNLCSAGAQLQAPPGVLGSGPWSWFCALPSDPANNAFCVARVQATVALDAWNQSGSPIAAAVWGQPIQLRGSVTGSGPGGTPSGALTFADVTGGAFRPICVDVTVAAPSLCNPASLPIDAGTRQLRAAYGGSGTHGATSGSRSLSVTRAVSVTSATNQPANPVPLGVPFSVTASVALNAPSAGTAYGSIEVLDFTDTSACTYELGAVPAGCVLTPASAGVHQLDIAFVGNGNIMPSLIATTQTVAKGATTTDAVLSPGTLMLGEPLTATVGVATPVPASVVAPAGLVTVAGAGTHCTITLPATTCQLVPTSVGTHVFSASYSGNANFAASTDSAQAVVAAASTNTNVSAEANMIFGETLAVSASVTTAVPPALAVPGGTMTIGDGLGAACTITLPATQCDFTPASAGSRTLTATYPGNASFAGSSNTTALAVARAATSLSVQSAQPTIALGQSVTVTSAVGSSVSAQLAVPSGTVAISDGAGATCTITLPAAGCELTPTTTGLRTITASYAGDGNFAPATNTATLDVLAAPAALALAVTDGRDHAQPGDVLQYAITLANTGNGAANDVAILGTPSANFGTATITWSCMPSGGATCAPDGHGAQLTDSVSLPPGSALAWTATLAVPTDAAGRELQFVVTAGDVSASDASLLPAVFGDGFERR